MKSVLLFLFLGISFCGQAQNLTGIWRGNFKSTPAGPQGRQLDLLGVDQRYKFEVQIDQNKKNFKGVTYSYLTTVFYGKATCQGTVNPATHQVLLEELKIVEVRMSGGSDACIMTLFLKYSKENDEEFLEGNYISYNTSDSTNCGRGTVFLRKVTTSDFYEEPFLANKDKQKPVESTPPAQKPVVKKIDTTAGKPKPAIAKTTPKTTNPQTTVKKPVTVTKPANKAVVKTPTETKPNVKIVETDTVKKVDVKVPPLARIPTPKVLANRENELVKTITTDAKEIEINIYDNGTVDNDTISVYVDKKLVLSNKRLTEKAIPLTISLDETVNYHELVMVAENLGEIPPNTSLMVVKAGSKQYEVRITSTEQKNAVIVFKYEP
ncbi:hypothetical protein A4H97_15655 [Niastella yeongjuensis]|uniref:Lipocalin-like domain-containing protein n=1 Tax=Niastella yeongjuensis TaxID=354355 RepID=A0A1V9E4H9_9BACT|nr:hypothetical protein [Niastella yeongjuensis]OQP41033.1 hypothetical protein A4H97_15655 [Niastella yeongjuensis]SEO94277.1 hypothetical protein SAMN05660816_03919 [Niastella yeongjuensis]